jgi:hypothetical protein
MGESSDNVDGVIAGMALVACIVMVVALSYVMIVTIYDPHYAQKYELCASLHYVQQKGCFLTENDFEFHVMDPYLREYLMDHQNTPLQLTIRKGILSDFIVGEKSYVEKYANVQRIPDEYLNNCDTV